MTGDMHELQVECDPDDSGELISVNNRRLQEKEEEKGFKDTNLNVVFILSMDVHEK